MSRECGNMKSVHSLRSLPSTGTVQITVSKYSKIARGGVCMCVCVWVGVCVWGGGGVDVCVCVGVCGQGLVT